MIEIDEPIQPGQAFGWDQSETAATSRLAFVLLLGLLYGGRDAVNVENVIQSAEGFTLPEPKPGGNFDYFTYLPRFLSRYDIEPTSDLADLDLESPEEETRRRDIIASLASRIYDKPNPETALDIALLSLGERDARLRAAAAISIADFFDNKILAVQSLLRVLDEAEDQVATELAAVALRRIGNSPRSSWVSSGPWVPSGPPRSSVQTGTARTGIIVHGTHFGGVGGRPIGNWWQPNGDFHTYITEEFCPGLYRRPDFYTWSGGYSDHARSLAAKELVEWVKNRGVNGLDVLAHSHGGSVVMAATHLGLEVDRLVLMSCPVHTANYLPNLSRVGSVRSYQIRLDLVVLADNGHFCFNKSGIEDHLLPKWFLRHDDTHSPDIWKSYDLAM